MSPAICVPTKELKNTAEFTETVRSAGGPVVVTKNGKEAFVSMSMDCYEALCLEGARARLYESIDRVQHYILASYLGMSPVTFSRTRTKVAAERDAAD